MNKTAEKILNVMKWRLRDRASNVASDAQVSESTARRHLEALVKSGHLSKEVVCWREGRMEYNSAYYSIVE
jgi:predicted ArsR family transcriptional regulator